MNLCRQADGPLADGGHRLNTEDMTAALKALLCSLQRSATEELNRRTAPAVSAGVRYPPTASRRPPTTSPPSRRDSNSPTELVTLIDLRCTPQVPGIHLQWTCAAPG